MRKFEFKKTYEEIEVAGEVYRVDVSDKKLKEYQIEFHEFYKESQRLEKIDVDELSAEEQTEMLDNALGILEKVVNKILGDGSFDVLYEKSGKSIMNMIDLVNYLGDVVNERLNGQRQEKRGHYLKHKQGKKKRRK